jgi:hypothetical protein
MSPSLPDGIAVQIKHVIGTDVFGMVWRVVGQLAETLFVSFTLLF